MKIIILLFTIGCVVTQPTEYAERAPSKTDFCVSYAMMGNCQSQYNALNGAYGGDGTNFSEVCRSASAFMDCVIDYADSNCRGVTTNDIKSSPTFASMGQLSKQLVPMSPDECGSFSAKFD